MNQYIQALLDGTQDTIDEKDFISKALEAPGCKYTLLAQNVVMAEMGMLVFSHRDTIGSDPDLKQALISHCLKLGNAAVECFVDQAERNFRGPHEENFKDRDKVPFIFADLVCETAYGKYSEQVPAWTSGSSLTPAVGKMAVSIAHFFDFRKPCQSPRVGEFRISFHEFMEVRDEMSVLRQFDIRVVPAR